MKPIALTQIDNAGVCRHRYAKTADGTTTHHITARYGSDTCHIEKNCGKYGFLSLGEFFISIENITLDNLY